MGGWVDSGEYVALLSGSWPRSALPNLIEPFSPMTPADLLLHTNKQAGDAARRLTHAKLPDQANRSGCFGAGQSVGQHLVMIG